MWLALKAAHEDQTSGGRIHWLYKLFLTQMEVSDDVETHLSKMRAIFDWFKALITDSTPLVPDDLFAAALIISLTPDLLKVVRPLMIQPSMTSDNVIHTLTQDNTFATTCRETDAPEASVSKTSKKNYNCTSKTSSYDSSLHCTFCNRDGHDLSVCNNARRILSAHKKDQPNQG